MQFKTFEIKHNLYLNIENFFKLKVLIKSDLTLTNECDVRCFVRKLIKEIGHRIHW
jgi:hypothetical protein